MATARAGSWEGRVSLSIVSATLRPFSASIRSKNVSSYAILAISLIQDYQGTFKTRYDSMLFFPWIQVVILNNLLSLWIWYSISQIMFCFSRLSSLWFRTREWIGRFPYYVETPFPVQSLETLLLLKVIFSLLLLFLLNPLVELRNLHWLM